MIKSRNIMNCKPSNHIMKKKFDHFNENIEVQPYKDKIKYSKGFAGILHKQYKQKAWAVLLSVFLIEKRFTS